MSEDSSQFTGTPDPLHGGANIPSDNAYDPSRNPYADDSYMPQQNADPDAQTQPVSTGSVSPEISSSSETGEQIIQPEIKPEIPLTSETKSDEEEVSHEKRSVSEERIDSPKEEPDEHVFESPFSVYGYQASKKILAQAMKGKSGGDINSARTWLLVLLGKLIKSRK